MLVVKSFTPAAKDLFRLIESDTGRPIMHVRQRFECDTFEDDAKHVLRTLETVERQIKSSEKDARYVMRMLPYRTAENVISGVVITFTDITRISAAEARIEELTRDLRARIDELETILDLIPIGVMITGKEDGADVLINAYGARLLGDEQRHKGLTVALSPFRLFEDGQELPRDSHPLEQAARRGETVSSWQGRLELENGHGTPVMVSATPLFAESGAIRGAVAAIVDISRHKQAEDQQELLLAELQHRVKNILATVGSLAMRLSDGRSVEAFNDAFLSRLTAMSRMHDLLASENWNGVSLKSLLEMALEPYATADKENVSLEGPDIRMGASAATTLGMIFHELVTNAAKYGALSAANGRVEARWGTLAGEPGNQQSIQLSWVEHDGPPVDGSRPAGFGTSLVTRSVEYELTGKANLELSPEGLRCRITFPVAGNIEEIPPEGG
jgi:two-component system, chemotaxis family, CheB/CheR fusion protein